MPLLFKQENHQYLSYPENSNATSLTEKEKDNNVNVDIDWISVTGLINHLKQPFDARSQAGKSAKNKQSKWYGMTPEDILQTWKAETTRAIKLGSWYHNQKEKEICAQRSIIVQGKSLPVIKPIYDEFGNKIAPIQRLEEGVYPEHFMYLKSAGICGQSDLIEVVNGMVNITDYKTNKEIKSAGFTNWEGITQKMRFPVSHLDDCNLKHYQLQLSIYLYIILKHNPQLRAGKMTIQHLSFEEKGQDKFGYPVTRMDHNDQPIIKSLVPYELSYMRDEVISIMHWVRDNKPALLKKGNK